MAYTNDFNPKQMMLDKIKENGGWVNAHAHIDRANIISEKTYKLVNATFKEKWHFADDLKRHASVDEIYEGMVKVVEDQIAQGVQAIGSFVDADPIVEDRAVKAAMRLREAYGSKIELRFATQVVKGVLDPEAQKWFEIGAQQVDFIGGLPERDEGREAEHYDMLFETAKKFGNKPLHVHVDQQNTPEQNHTELLIQKTIEHGYEGKVAAVHCISVGSQPRQKRHELYKKMKDAGIIVIACPGAWIDNSWVAGMDHDVIGPIHNSVTPVKEMLEYGVTVALGTDGIQDIYKPFTDGDMWTELRFLLEAQRIYEIADLVDIASTNGRKALWLD